MVQLVPVVEGQAEVAALPVLLRRMLEDLEAFSITIARPYRVKRNRVTRPGELERALKQALRSRAGAGGYLVVLDADDDCPVELAASLRQRAREVTSVPGAVVLANREFEAWLLGAKTSLRGRRGIHHDAQAPPEPESIRGAKEHLSENMYPRRYVPVDDQPALAEQFDLQAALKSCRSFAKLRREVERLSHLLTAPGA